MFTFVFTELLPEAGLLRMFFCAICEEGQQPVSKTMMPYCHMDIIYPNDLSNKTAAFLSAKSCAAKLHV